MPPSPNLKLTRPKNPTVSSSRKPNLTPSKASHSKTPSTKKPHSTSQSKPIIKSRPPSQARPQPILRHHTFCCVCRSHSPLLVCIGPYNPSSPCNPRPQKICGHTTASCTKCRKVTEERVYTCLACGVVNSVMKPEGKCKVCGMRRRREWETRWRARR